MSTPVIYWFRRDLRLASNPGLAAAAAEGPLVCIFVRDTALPPDHDAGGAARWWLHHSLQSLRGDLAERGVRLVLLTGDPLEQLPALATRTGARALHFSRVHEPEVLARDKRLVASLRETGLTVAVHNASLLHEPWTVSNQSGKPYKVFTQFWKRGCLGQRIEPMAPAPAPAMEAASPVPRGEKLETWGWHPRHPDWSGGLAERWQPGEGGAIERLECFVEGGLAGYSKGRDRPDQNHVSELSPHLQHGEIAPWQVWNAACSAAAGAARVSDADLESFLRELGWREFSHHLLYHFPDLPHSNWRPAFNAFPWRKDPDALAAWQRGQTGYPLVDAGMRELWATGYMHGRVRMVTASFLIKHLRLDWRHGERWFRDTLVDASLAQNSANWQWVAGSGADAAPYFRIFNPILQGEKFDPDGHYVRRWVPELAGLPAPAIHAPWKLPASALADAGVRLGRDYPEPMVDHAAARTAALEAYKSVKAAAADSQ